MESIMLIIMLMLSVLLVVLLLASFALKGRKSLMQNMMKDNLDVLKGMHTEEMGETLKDLSKTAINVRKNILQENEEALKEIAEIEANIEKGAIKTKAQAVKEGFAYNASVTDNIFCKHCGSKIDSDSKFCKNCGNKQ